MSGEEKGRIGGWLKVMLVRNGGGKKQAHGESRFEEREAVKVL